MLMVGYKIHPTHERFTADYSRLRDIFLRMIAHGLFPKRKESILDILCDYVIYVGSTNIL